MAIQNVKFFGRYKKKKRTATVPEKKGYYNLEYPIKRLVNSGAGAVFIQNLLNLRTFVKKR